MTMNMFARSNSCLANPNGLIFGPRDEQAFADYFSRRNFAFFGIFDPERLDDVTHTLVGLARDAGMRQTHFGSRQVIFDNPGPRLWEPKDLRGRNREPAQKLFYIFNYPQERRRLGSELEWFTQWLTLCEWAKIYNYRVAGALVINLPRLAASRLRLGIAQDETHILILPGKKSLASQLEDCPDAQSSCKNRGVCHSPYKNGCSEYERVACGCPCNRHHLEKSPLSSKI